MRQKVASAHKARPNTRFAAYERAFTGDRAWYRFTLKWSDADSGETRTRVGMQLLLALGTAWSDPVAQETWTSPRTS